MPQIGIAKPRPIRPIKTALEVSRKFFSGVLFSARIRATRGTKSPISAIPEPIRP